MVTVTGWGVVPRHLDEDEGELRENAIESLLLENQLDPILVICRFFT